MVIYRALCSDEGVWVRPAAMWNEMVEHNGQHVKRFTHENEIVPEPPVGVHKYSTPAEKVELFLSCFAGRDDVFAKRWENPKKGIMDMFPPVITSGVLVVLSPAGVK